jgi:hypothetical protein
LTDGRVVVDVEALTQAEKERILYNHLKFGKQPRSFLLWLRPPSRCGCCVSVFSPGDRFLDAPSAHAAHTSRIT